MFGVGAIPFPCVECRFGPESAQSDAATMHPADVKPPDRRREAVRLTGRGLDYLLVQLG